MRESMDIRRIRNHNKKCGQKPSFFCMAVLFAALFALSGCQNDTSRQKEKQEEKVEGVSLCPAVSDVIYASFRDKVVLCGVFFADYKGELVPVSIMDTTADITIRSSMDKQKLSKLTWIKELTLHDYDSTNLAYIKNLTQLESLTVSGGVIRDISALSEFTNLKVLSIYGDKISDISALSNLTNLEKLNLYGNEISDISALSNLTSLEELYLDSNEISDISALSNLTNLEELYLGSNEISDISALEKLTNLKNLSLQSNKVSDLSPLSNLMGLEEVRLYENEISDLSPLAGHANLRFLGLDYNPIEDISPLSSLDSGTYLCLRGTNLAWDDWEPVKHLKEVNGRVPASLAGAGEKPCPQSFIEKIYEKYPDGRIISLDYDDYDKDGAYEAFALVSDEKGTYLDFGYIGALVMVTEDSVQELLEDSNFGFGIDIGGYYWLGDTKVIFANHYVAATSSVSYLWTVEGGKPRAMNLSHMGQWFYVDEFGNACILHSAYDGDSEYCGHSYKPYYFYFDGYDFVEYGAIPITEEEFLRCRGAEEALGEIREEGLELMEILYRGNGMIHINLRQYSEGENDGQGESAQNRENEQDDRYYSNSYKTFHLSEDGQITLVDSDMGYYYDRYINIENFPAEYPSCFPVQE